VWGLLYVGNAPFGRKRAWGNGQAVFSPLFAQKSFYMSSTVLPQFFDTGRINVDYIQNKWWLTMGGGAVWRRRVPFAAAAIRLLGCRLSVMSALAGPATGGLK